MIGGRSAISHFTEGIQTYKCVYKKQIESMILHHK